MRIGYRLFPMLAIVMVPLLFLGVPIASAHNTAPAIPFTNAVCNSSINPCEAIQEWNSGVSDHGAGSDFTVDNPGVSGSEYYAKYIYVANSTSFEEVGIEKNFFPSGSGCTSSTTLYYFYNDNNNGVTCKQAVPSGDVNTLVVFELSYYASNGGGGFAWILDNCNGTCSGPCNPCSFSNSGLTSNFTDSKEEVYYYRASFTGHAVWGGEFTVNQFYLHGSWSYDSTAGTLTIKDNGGSLGVTSTCNNNTVSGAPPPPEQGCWNSKPNGATNLGGQLYTCTYDSSVNNCTQGS